MLKNYYSSFIYAMGEVSILFIILSLVFSETIEINHLYQMVCVFIPAHLFSFLTFELRLFSKHIWIRRMIVIAFGLLVLFVSELAFAGLRLEFKGLIAYSISALFCIIVTVFAYYVTDKIEQRNLELINQKLGEKNTGHTE